MKYWCIFLGLFIFSGLIYAQDNKQISTPKTQFVGADGVILAGYIDNGTFINFTGPSISIIIKQSKFLFGMLPSLRYKEDHSKPKNAPVMPGLGAGITYSYKKFAIQVPFYYNAKTPVKNGEWVVGCGIGIRLKK